MIYLFDIDGVIIHYGSYFSRTLSLQKYENPTKVMDEYFQSTLNCDCDKGKRDIFEEIKPYLAKMKWYGNPEDYFKSQWNFEKDFIIKEILNKINKLKNYGHKVFIASNQNSYRKQFLIQEMQLNTNFNNCFFSCDIGYVKNENEYWEYIEDYFLKNKIDKEEVLFFDDLFENVNMAKSHGINSIQINGKQQVLDFLENEIKKMA